MAKHRTFSLFLESLTLLSVLCRAADQTSQKLFECCLPNPNGFGLAHSSGIQRLETGRTDFGTLVLCICLRGTRAINGGPRPVQNSKHGVRGAQGVQGQESGARRGAGRSSVGTMDRLVSSNQQVSNQYLAALLL